MPSLCKNCQKYPVFTHGYCKNCSYLYYNTRDKKSLKSLLNQYKKGNTKIKPRSEKRMLQEKEYREVKKERELELKAKGEWRCIFCNIGFMDIEIPDWHHLGGRIEDKLTDGKYLYPAHTICHITNYHQATVEHMKSMFWYEGFLKRIKNIGINLYNKEMRKEDKS